MSVGRDDRELGEAFRRVMRALPDMPTYVAPKGKWDLSFEFEYGKWRAEAFQPIDDDWDSESAEGETLWEAMDALAAKLETM